MEKVQKEYSLANKIKLLRESSNLSQEYVASKLNISQQAYSRMENHPEGITVKRLMDLSQILGVPMNTLIGEDDLYIQQNFNQQGGNAGTVLYVQGLAETERNAYEKHIQDLKQQIDILNNLLMKLSK